LATTARRALGMMSIVLGIKFLKSVLRGPKPKRPPPDYSDPVTLRNGSTAYGIIRNGVLRLVVITDKKGNTLEVEPQFVNTSLLKLKPDIVIPKFE
jgi:hypothetical protein